MKAATGNRQGMPGGGGRSGLPSVRVGIACGGTGGHLFPGLAVGEALRQQGAEVTLFVSPKEVDRRAVQALEGWAVEVLPVAAWQAGSRWRCLTGWLRAWSRVRRLCRAGEPWVVLGMGGFSSVPVLAAARRAGHPVFLHESNAVPGRANRWLVRWVERAFVGFECAAEAWQGRPVECTGTPVRSSFVEAGRLEATRRAVEQRRVRVTLGLDAEAPTVLVVGGSQGARGLNDAVLQALPQWQRTRPGVQWIHVTGSGDEKRVRAAYATHGVRAVVIAFSETLAELMLAATAVLSRAGASFLAELAAVGVPALLVPFPAAAGNHQWHNARCLAESGAARVLRQHEATGERLIRELGELLEWEPLRESMVRAQRRWFRPDAAARIAQVVWEAGQKRAAVARSRMCCRPTVAAIHG